MSGLLPVVGMPAGPGSARSRWMLRSLRSLSRGRGRQAVPQLAWRARHPVPADFVLSACRPAYWRAYRPVLYRSWQPPLALSRAVLRKPDRPLPARRSPGPARDERPQSLALPARREQPGPALPASRLPAPRARWQAPAASSQAARRKRFPAPRARTNCWQMIHGPRATVLPRQARKRGSTSTARSLRTGSENREAWRAEILRKLGGRERGGH